MNNQWRHNLPAFGLTAIALALAQVDAFAQDAAAAPGAAASGPATAVQSVVVTAERRTQDLQKTAISMTVLDGDDLQSKGKSDPFDIFQSVPAVVVQDPGPNAPILAIRGLGSDGPNKAAATAIYVDGVIVTQSAAQFYDLSRVEVLRGPQGTLYGRGATGGAVNFVTRDPGRKFGGDVTVEAGSYSLLHTTGGIDIPLTDELSARFSFNQTKRQGYLSNDQDDQDDHNVRLKLQYKPSQAVSALLGVEYFRNSANGPGNVTLDAHGNIDNLSTSSPRGSYLDNIYKRVWANINLDIGFATLTYIPAYQNYTTDKLSFINGGVNGVGSPQDAYLTNELRLASGKGSGKLSWVGGLYTSKRGNVASTSIASDQTLPVDYFLRIDQREDVRNVSLFGEGTYALDTASRVTLGARKSWDHDIYNESDVGFGVIPPFPVGTTVIPTFDRKYSRFDYKARFEHDLGSKSMAYAVFSTGYRPGGEAVNGSGYGLESIKAFEVGSKNRFLDDRLQLNASVFHYQYSGYQSPTPLFLNNDPTSNVIIGTTIANAPARFDGAEAELVYLPTYDDRVTVSPAFLKSRLENGLPVSHAPRWDVSAGYEHSFWLQSGGSINAGLDAKFQSSQYVAYNNPVQPATLQKAYTLLNLHLGYSAPMDRYSVSAYLKNATDVLVKQSVVGSNAAVAPPRVFGVVANVHF